MSAGDGYGRAGVHLDGEWNAVGQGTGLYWRYESSLKRSENQLGSVLVGCGSLLIVRRAQLHQPLDPRMANDLEIPVRIGAQGKAILYDAEIIGAEKPHTHAEEELQRTSALCGDARLTMLFPEFLKSPLRLWQFLSHSFYAGSLCRWGFFCLSAVWFCEITLFH